jgi:hypothetical protein
MSTMCSRLSALINTEEPLSQLAEQFARLATKLEMFMEHTVEHRQESVRVLTEHGERLRALENAWQKILGISMVVGLVAGAIAAALVEKIFG